MVQNLSNKIEYLGTEKKYRTLSFDLEAEEFRKLFKDYQEKTAHDLIEIVSNSKNKNSRLVAVYLLGRNKSEDSTIKKTLRNLLSYEASAVKKEAIWSLARIGDTNILTSLLSLLPRCENEVERSITIRLIGRVGDKQTILPLLKLYVEFNELSSMSAGLALNEIINKIGIEPIAIELFNKDKNIRKAVIWLLSARAQFTTREERKKIVKYLKEALISEKTPSLQLLLAYNLSLLNIPEGTKELLHLSLANKIDKKRQQFFWNEITRSYIYCQKQSSLELVKRLNEGITSKDFDSKNNEKTILSILKKLEKLISNIDSIFDW